MQRGKGVGEVVGGEVVGVDVAVHQAARGQYAVAGIGGVGQEVLKAVGAGKHVVVHAPYPLRPLLHGLGYATMKAARATHIGLRDDGEMRGGQRGQVVGRAVGTAVVDHHDVAHAAVGAQAFQVSLQQGQTVEGDDNGYDVHGDEG